MSNFRRPKNRKKLSRGFTQQNLRRPKGCRFKGESLENRVLLAADVAAPFQNQFDRFDVNHDGEHTISDALYVVSEIRETGPRPLIIPLASAGSSGEGEGEGEGGMSIDVNGDNLLTLNDALDVLQRLRSEAEDDSVTTQEDTSVFIDVLDNDSGATDNARIVGFSTPTDTLDGMPQGSITPTFNNPGGGDFSITALTYVPPANYSGQVSFSYTWNDTSNGNSDTSMVTINVTEVNDDPTALVDTFTVPNGNPLLQGQTVTLDVLANDSTAPDNPALENLTLVSVGTFTGGTASITQDQQVELTLDPHFFNSSAASFATLSYTIEDGRGGTANGLIEFEVVPTEQPVRVRVEAVNASNGQPIVGDIGVGTEFDLQIFARDIRDLSFLDSGLAQVAGDILFENTDLSSEQRISVLPADSGTQIHGFSLDVEFSEDFRGFLTTPTLEPNKINRLSGVWTDFLDLNADPLGPGEFLVATIGVRADAAGTVNINGGLPDEVGADTSLIEPTVITVFTPGESPFLADGTTPVIDFIGESVTIVALVDAVDDTRTVAEDSGPVTIPVTANDNVVAPGVISLNSVSTGSRGGTIVQQGNSISYTPVANVNGTETFTYTIQDGRGNSSTGTVTITITPENDDPTANADSATVNEDSSDNPIELLANDSIDPDTGETLSITGVSNFSAGGSATINGSEVNYTPAADFFGQETFTYTISDGNGGTDTATVTVTVNNVNDDPDAINDTATVDEDSGSNSIDVLANDLIAPDANETLTITGVSAATSGTTSHDGTQVFYTPNDDFFGIDSFTYTISDGNGGVDTATVNVTVNNVNDDPIATDDTFQVKAGETVAFDVLFNDNDILDGDTLTISAIGANTVGEATITRINGNTEIEYNVPVTVFNVTDTFTYTISDGNGGSATANVTVQILPPTLPIAINDTATVAEDSGTTGIDVLANDFRNDDPAEFEIIALGTPSNGGTVTVNTNGTATTDDDFIDYTPAADFFGEETFTYTATDNTNDGDGVDFSTGTVTVTVTNVNDAPVAVDDAYSVNEDTTLTVDLANAVVVNDTDVDGDTLGAILVSDVSNGTLNLNADGSFTYTPSSNFNGTDSFTYLANDGTVDSTNTATVTITVNPINDGPIAVDDAFSVNEDTTLTVDLTNAVVNNDTDVEGDTLTAVLVSDVSNGTLNLNADGTFTYTPDQDFNGTDSFTYRANDGTMDSGNIATVTITVNPINDAPVAVDDAYSVDEDTTLTVTLANSVLINDTDVDGDSLNAFRVVNVTNGTLAFNGDGTFTYTPNQDFNGTDTFTYRANDNTVNSANLATVTITVNPVNDAPVAVDDAYSVDEDETLTVNLANSVVVNDTDVEGDTLSAVLVSDVSNGMLNLNSDGSFTYTPDQDFNGTDTFTYQANDGSVDSTNTATVTITVNPINDAPVAVDDSFMVDEDNTLTVALTDTIVSNDTDVDLDTLSAILATDVSNGTLNLNANGTFTYTPDLNFNGTDSFTYRTHDGNENSTNVATVTITVNPINDDPVANDDSLTATEADPAENDATNTTILNPLANDTDVEFDTLTITEVGSSTLGASISIFGGGTTIDYLPPVDTFNVTDTFSYTISDGNGGTDSAMITVFIEPLSLPRARNDMATVDEDSTANAIDVLDNDRKNDSGTIEITSIDNISSGGTVVVNDNGTPGDTEDDFIDYTPAADFQGTETFTYTITDNFNDGDGVDSSTATVTVVVNNLNDDPTAVDDTASVDEDSTSNVIDVLDNDLFAPDPVETLTITNVAFISGTAGNGVFDQGTIVNQGTHLEYTPADDFFGTVTFSYTISDGNGGADTGELTITVDNVNDDPTANDDSFTGIVEDSMLADNLLDVLANDQIFPDVGETLTITAVGATSNGGTVTIDGGTALRYQPAADFFGTETFTYTISDGNGGMAMAVVSVQVDNVNDNPDAVDDFFERILQTSSDNDLDVLANDSFAPDDQNGNVETLTITGLGVANDATITTANGSTVEIAPDGMSVIFSPNGTFEGTDSFTYTISDGNGGVDTATVDVEVINFLTGSISGYVYDDQNQDGDRDAGEQAYGGVEVNISGTDFTGAAFTDTTTTDANGRYSFDDLVPGDYEVSIEQPAFTLNGVYDSDTGDATIGTNDSGDTVFEFSFDILDGTQATENNFRMSGFDPGQVNSVWDLLASSSGNQAIAIVNTNGGGGEFFTLRDGWESMQSVSVEIVDADTVLLHVTDGNGTVHSPIEIPAIRETEGGPYFRILAEDSATGMVAIRIIATPAQLGLTTAPMN